MDQLSCALEAEFLENVVFMILYCPVTDIQLLGNGFDRMAFSAKAHNFQFPCRKSLSFFNLFGGRDCVDDFGYIAAKIFHAIAYGFDCGFYRVGI